MSDNASPLYPRRQCELECATRLNDVLTFAIVSGFSYNLLAARTSPSNHNNSIKAPLLIRFRAPVTVSQRLLLFAMEMQDASGGSILLKFLFIRQNNEERNVEND